MLMGTSALKLQLEMFASDNTELAAYPQLLHELIAYALVPAVSRRTEAMHASISGHKRKASFVTVPFITAHARQGDALHRLQSPAFMQ